MTTVTRSEIDALYTKYKERILTSPTAAKYDQALVYVGERLHSQSSHGPPSVELRDLGRILKMYLPELSGKMGLETAHGHFTVAVLQYATGTDLPRALKRARVVFDKNRRHLAVWIAARLKEVNEAAAAA